MPIVCLTLAAVLLGAGPDAGDVDGVIELFVGQSRRLHVPGVQRIAVSAASMYEAKTVGNDDVEITAYREGKTTLLMWTNDGTRRAWSIVCRERNTRGDGPGLTELRRGEEAFIAAAGVVSAKAVNPKVVRAEVADGGVSVTALDLGDSDVQVKTKAGPIMHRFEVR